MLHFFNPGHETAVLNASPYYTASAIQQKMQRDLALLPVWYASPDDAVWVETEVDPTYFESLSKWGLPLPAIIERRQAAKQVSRLSGREVVPWGISPQSIQLFKNIDRQYGLNLRIPDWKPEFTRLCSRLSAGECLAFLLERLPGLSPGLIPEYHTRAETVIEKMKSAEGAYIVKSPYSSSGRGLLWLQPGEVDRASRQLLQGMLNRQSIVSLERALDKQLDFSMQFYADGQGRVIFQGLSMFKTDAKGNYQGTYLASQSRIRARIREAFPEWNQYEGLCLEELTNFLQSCYAVLYKGNIGVDMLIYQDEGVSRLYPCVEINMRTTMGYLALQLHRRLYREESEGCFYIDYHSRPAELYAMHRKAEAEYPLFCRDGKVVGGYWALCPVRDTSNYRAYVQVD